MESLNEALREQERRESTLIGNLPGMAYRCRNDPLWRMEFVSFGVEALIGYRPEQLTDGAIAFGDLIHADDREAVWQSVQQAIAQGAKFQLEYRLRNSTGDYRWVWEQGCAVPDATGQIIAIEGFITDITPRKESEAALRASEERFRLVIENARDGIFSLGPDQTLLSVNTALERITGWMREEWLGKTFAPLVHPDDLPIAFDRYAKVMAGEQPEPFELRIATKDGGHIELEFTVAPHREGSRVVGVIGIVRDMRERRLLEERLRTAQKMEAIGLLAGGIAHDFNNIVTIILGHASLLKAADLSQAQLESVETISDAAERAARLTRQLLTFGRKQLVQPRTVAPTEIVRRLASSCQRLLDKSIVLEIDVPADLPLILADPVMIEQALNALVVNAQEAMPTGGRLRITARGWTEEFDGPRDAAPRPGGFVCFEVSDTGIGISPENLSRIFDPFFTTKPPGQGNGIGLATVYSIIRQHRGWIDVESRPGEGTTFRLHLPYGDGERSSLPAPEKARSAPADRPQGIEHILVVEDEKPLRQLVRNLLERHGYQVSSAESAPAALEIWRRRAGAVDLLLTDLVMPDGMNGHQLAEQLQREKPGLKVIFTSGYDEQMVSSGEIVPEHVKLIQKPYDPAKLLAEIRECLDRG